MIEKKSGSVEGLDPKLGRKASLKEKCANNIVGGAYHAFCLAVLWWCVREREAIGDAIVGDGCAKGGVDESATIITLHAFNECVKLVRM